MVLKKKINKNSHCSGKISHCSSSSLSYSIHTRAFQSTSSPGLLSHLPQSHSILSLHELSKSHSITIHSRNPSRSLLPLFPLHQFPSLSLLPLVTVLTGRRGAAATGAAGLPRPVRGPREPRRLARGTDGGRAEAAAAGPAEQARGSGGGRIGEQRRPARRRRESPACSWSLVAVARQRLLGSKVMPHRRSVRSSAL